MYSQIVTAPSLVRNGGWLPESLSRPLTGVAPLAETGFSSGVGGSVSSPQRGLTSRGAGRSSRSSGGRLHGIGRRRAPSRASCRRRAVCTSTASPCASCPLTYASPGRPLALHAPPEFSDPFRPCCWRRRRLSVARATPHGCTACQKSPVSTLLQRASSSAAT